MSNYGIKISRPGFDVKTAQPNQLSFSSKYKTLKVHSSGSGTLTDSSRTATIPHGLGYVPLFMVHSTSNEGFGSGLFSSGDYVLTPAGLSGVLANPSVGVNDDLFAYADSTNLYIKAQENWGSKIFSVSNQANLDQCLAYEYSFFGGGTGTGSAWLGRTDSSLGVYYGAIRFGDVTVANGTSVYKATMNFKVDSRDGGGEVKASVWGIDEDNTGNFNSGTAATARSKTTATDNYAATLSAGNSWGMDVKDQVNEIFARAGWASGNALGIMFWDNGTTDGNAYYELFGDSTLNILENSTIASYKYTIFKNQLE